MPQKHIQVKMFSPRCRSGAVVDVEDFDAELHERGNP